MIRLLAILLLFTAASPTFAQLDQDEQRRCEAILLHVIDANKQPNLYTIGMCKYLPIGRVGDHLESALKSKDLAVRLDAANHCLEQAPTRFRELIQQSMTEIQTRFERGEVPLPPDVDEKSQDEKRKEIMDAMIKADNALRLPSQTQMVQRAAVLMKLGDAKATRTIEGWVQQNPSAMKGPRWICPMMCVHPSSKQGRCAVCAMELVNALPLVTQDDWRAKLAAIRAYQESGNRVAAAARSIVISEATPDVRLFAADIWSKEAPVDALPHIAIFLHGGSRWLALDLLSVSMPDRFVKEFEAIVNSPKLSFTHRMSAYNSPLAPLH